MADKLQDLVVEFVDETNNGIYNKFQIDILQKEEIKLSLESIFPRTGFLYWISQSDVEKVSKMQKLPSIVLGICTYNRARDGSSSAINPTYYSFESEATILEKNIQNEIDWALERIAGYSKAIKLHIHSLGIHHVLMQRLRDELHYDHQLLALLQDLSCTLKESRLAMGNLMEHTEEQLEILCTTIGMETCIPNELVLSNFQNIGLLQKKALTELRKFRAQRRIAEEIFTFSSKAHYNRTPSGLSKIQVLAGSCSFLPSNLYKTATCHVLASLSEVESFEDSKTGNADAENVIKIEGEEFLLSKHLRLHLNGFCVMSIVCHMGLLLLGDPRLGLVQVGDKIYAFANHSHHNEFAKSPFKYLRALEKVVIAMPQLINTLGLQRESKFSKLAMPNILELANRTLTQHNFATQTVTQPQAEHGLDRDILLLRAKELSNKLTHSTQTYKSHFHRDCCSQVWLPRDKSTQSVFGKGTTMPTKLKFFENLRGPPCVKFNTMDILLDV